MSQQRHATLPQTLTDQELQQWIIRSSVERFMDKTKRYYEAEEIADFEHESSVNGRKINMLQGILKKCTEAIQKGTIEDIVITIPKNDGTKNYDAFRFQNDNLIDAGFEEIACEVFGIVNVDNEVMEYFTLAGKCIDERTRPLSIKEKQEYLPVRQMATTRRHDGQEGAGDAKLYIDGSLGKTADNTGGF